QVYLLRRRLPGRTGPYRDLRGDVEGGLQTRPVSVEEYERWRRRMLLRHGYRAALPPPAEDG
ncbi:MAG: hypothetical protein ACE5JG_05885, partial [Planctomycetota bacterium]